MTKEKYPRSRDSLPRSKFSSQDDTRKGAPELEKPKEEFQGEREGMGEKNPEKGDRIFVKGRRYKVVVDADERQRRRDIQRKRAERAADRPEREQKEKLKQAQRAEWWRKLQAEAAEKREKKERRERLKQAEEEERRAKIAQETARKKKEKLVELESVFENDFLNARLFFEETCRPTLSVEDFANAKVAFVTDWLRRNLRVPPERFPSLEQINAIAAVDGNVQLRARAGSGKTSTVINRAYFLIKHCRVPASSILVTAFNKKAVEELEERLFKLLYPGTLEDLIHKASKRAVRENRKFSIDQSEMRREFIKKAGEPFPLVTTFHSLALHLAHVSGALLQEDEDNPRLSKMFSEIKNEFLHSPAQFNRVRRAMLAFHKTDWERIEREGKALSRDEFLALRRADSSLTLAGEHVKSSGEQAVANFLFENNVPYRYEAAVSWDGKGATYRPDFLILTGDNSALVIEYFGLAGQPSYDTKTEEKLRWFETKSNYALLALYPDDLRRGRDYFEGKVKDALSEHGVTLEPLSEDEVWERARKDIIDEFDKSLTNFVTRSRNELLSANALREKERRHSPASEAEKAFVSLAIDVLAAYADRLEELNDWDWPKVFSDASERLRAGRLSFRRLNWDWRVLDFSFFFIDEFQDFTPSFAQLVTAFQFSNPRIRLFCVGDDWQAINGFAGAKLEYFTKFEDFFGTSSVLNIATNYRSAQGIVSLGNSLMVGCGPGAAAASREPAFIAVADLADFRRTPLEKEHLGDRGLSILLRLVVHLFDQGCTSVSILSHFKMRYEPTLFFENRSTVSIEGVASRLKKYLPLRYREYELRSSTVHAFKGKESQGVILLDCVKGAYPFLHPTWEINRIFGDSTGSLEQQERLLFYVGLTRAENHLIFVTNSESQISPFLVNLESTRNLEKIDWSDLRPVLSAGSNLVRIKDSAASSYATWRVRGLLKKSGYKFSKQNFPCWERILGEEGGFDIKGIRMEGWAQQVEDVIVEHVGDGGRVLASYQLSRGTWRRI